MSTELWVRVAAVGRHLGVSHDRVFRWIDAKALPVYEVGWLWELKLAAVREWDRGGGATEDGAGSSIGGHE